MLTIGDILASEDVLRVREQLARISFLDGRRTAGASARRVKFNQQAAAGDAHQGLGRFVRQALERSEVFTAYARPVRWSKLIFSRYAPGDAYGTHMDAAVMKADGGGELRTDLSFTVFLSGPETYEGGALVVEGLDGERSARPPAGSVVLYQTGALHRVDPVTAGERLACVGWIQSLVRGDGRRKLLFDLERVRTATPDPESRLLLEKSIGGLLRRWGAV